MPGVFKGPQLGSSTTGKRYSRTGCAMCKLRKIKCDETHPNCKNCLRRGLQCIYIWVSGINREKRSIKSDNPLFSTPSANFPILKSSRLHYTPVEPEYHSPFNNHHNYKNGNYVSTQIHEIGPDSTHNEISGNLPYLNEVSDENVVEDLKNLSAYGGGSLSLLGATYLLSLFPGSEIKVEENTGRIILKSQDAYEYGFYYVSHKSDNDSNASDDEDEVDENETLLIASLSPQDVILKRVKELRLYTQINFQFVEYFTTQFYLKLSDDFQTQKGWLITFGLGSSHTHFMHISLAMVALDFYYNATRLYIEQDRSDGKLYHRRKIPAIKLLEDREGYLRLAEYHQTKSLEILKESIGSKKFKDGSFETSITHIGTGLLHVLYCLFSPNYRLSGGSLIQLGSGLGAVYRINKPDLGNENFFKSLVYRVAHHHDLTKFPDVNFSQIFVPRYLYGLLELQCFESDKNLKELEERVDTYLWALKYLCICYEQVYNNVVPERDIVTIVTRFFVDCKMEFGKLIVNRDPRALIIMGHLVLLISTMVNPRYWSQDCIIDEIKDLTSYLDHHWRPWMAIPLQTVTALASLDSGFNEQFVRLE